MPSEREQQAARLQTCLENLQQALAQTKRQHDSQSFVTDMQTRLEDLLLPMSLAVEQARTEVLRGEQTRRADVDTMSELISYLAHELNQPLAAVVTNAQACGRWLGHHPPNLTEAHLSVRGIADDAQRASRIIAELRARLQPSQTVRERVSIAALLHDVAAITQAQAAAHAVALELEVRCDHDVPDVLADPSRLEHVLHELIDNALHAMALSPVRRLALLGTRGEHGDACVAVRDAGPGLQDRERDRVFDPLYTSRPEELGLGLTVCRSIVRSHGGRVWASANEGGGETFLFSLPAAALTV